MSRHVHIGDMTTPGYGMGVNGTPWPYLVAIAKGASVDLTRILHGGMSADYASLIYSYAPQSGDRVIYLPGIGEQEFYGTDPAKRDNFAAIMAAQVYWLAGTKMLGNDPAISYSANWIAGYTFGLGFGKRSTGLGTASIPFNGNFLLFTQRQDGNTASFQISIDGVDKGTYSTTNGAAISTKGDPGDLPAGLPARAPSTFGPALIRIPCSPGSHTAVVTALAPNVYIDAVGTGSSGLPVYLCTTIRRGATAYVLGSDANNAAYNAELLTNVANGHADGLSNLFFVDTCSAIGTGQDSLVDLDHPTNLGNCEIATAVSPAIP